MASFGGQGANRFLGVFKRKGRFDTGIGAELPEAYKKFWREWKVMRPAAVHYVPQEGRWRKDEVTGEIFPVQNVPIPLKFPKEAHQGIWGGEGIIQGFQKRDRRRRRVAHFWVPVLKRSVIRSDVLNMHLSVIVTDRTLKLILDNYGFDHYLLKTPACDLQSELALKLKQKILRALEQNCPAYNDDPEKQKEIYDQYKNYLSAYSAEDIEWYGLTMNQAVHKMILIKEKNNIPVPLKQKYRSQLIEKLKEAGIAEAQEAQLGADNSSWVSKMNIFGKKQET